MSIPDKITVINNAISTAYISVADKEDTVPSTRSLGYLIDEIHSI